MPQSDGSDGSDVVDSECEDPAQEAEAMEELGALLRDPAWHPCAIPVRLKRILCTSTTKLARCMKRWYYKALLAKSFLHDRHKGEPVTIPPAYGHDSGNDSSEAASEAEDDGAVHSRGQTVQLRAVTWNTCLLYTSPSPRDGLLSRMPSSA